MLPIILLATLLLMFLGATSLSGGPTLLLLTGLIVGLAPASRRMFCSWRLTDEPRR